MTGNVMLGSQLGPMSNHILDLLCYEFRWLMFPKPQRHPSLRFELANYPKIASLVGGQFFSPPIGVVLRHRAVLWATVPEAPVNENSDLRSFENEVRPTPHPSNRRFVDSIPKTLGVDKPTHSELGHGVRSRLPLQALPC